MNIVLLVFGPGSHDEMVYYTVVQFYSTSNGGV